MKNEECIIFSYQSLKFKNKTSGRAPNVCVVDVDMRNRSQRQTAAPEKLSVFISSSLQIFFSNDYKRVYRKTEWLPTIFAR